MNKYLVTGGAGFIGSHLVNRLVQMGKRVVVVDNLETGSKDNLSGVLKNDKFEFIKRDVTDNLDEIFEKNKFDAVFHLAALPRVQYSIDYPDLAHKTNVSGTFNILNLARLHKVKRFIFTSSSSVYGDQEKLPLVETMTPNPMSPYALHKLIGEQYCTLYHKIYGLEVISLRYFNVYGPKQNPTGGYANLIPKLIYLISHNQSPTINNTGKQTRDFAYVNDVVEANVLACETTNKECFGQAFNVGSGTAYSVNDVVKLVMKLTGKNPPVLKGPQVIEPRDTLADITKIRKNLGWEPKISFEEGLKRMISATNV